MKTFVVTLLALAMGITTTMSRSLEITIEDIRSDKGQILVMARVAGQEKPVYGMTAAKKGSVVMTLPGLETDAAEVSIFHDEDGNYQMKMGDHGPLEGYASKKCELPEEKNVIKLSLYYPVPEK